MVWRMMRMTKARRRASGLLRSRRSKKLGCPTARPAVVAAAASCAYAAAVTVPSLRNTSHCGAHPTALLAGKSIHSPRPVTPAATAFALLYNCGIRATVAQHQPLRRLQHQ